MIEALHKCPSCRWSGSIYLDPSKGWSCPDCGIHYYPLEVEEVDADMVNKPPHYTQGGIECINYIEQVLGIEGAIAFCRGNAIKYQHRAGKKWDTVEDLKKEQWYSQKALELIQKKDATV